MSESEQNGGTMSEPSELPAESGTPKKGNALKYVGAVLLAVVFLLAGLLAGWLIGVSSVDERARNLVWLLERVEENYYKEVDDETLYDNLFQALELDKFCTYYNVDEYEALVDESRGQNSGFGVSLIYEGDVVRLYRTVYNSPAERAGLEAGMYLYRYSDGEGMKDVSAATFYDFLSSAREVTVEAGFSADEKKTYTISRAAYLAAYCEYRDSGKSFRFRGDSKPELTETGEGMSALDGKTAYIRLAQFDGNAASEFTACLDLMRERGRTDLILDLRSNGGGYLTTLCDIASHLLKDAEGNSPLVATSRYRSGKKDSYTAPRNDYFSYFLEGSRIRVLADENTASASEALMGAMLDYGTIGEEDVFLRVSETDGERVARTYGKGVMQSTFVAPDGRALRLTVAEIFWPKGNSIHGVGLRAEGKNAVEADPFASASEFLRLMEANA